MIKISKKISSSLLQQFTTHTSSLSIIKNYYSTNSSNNNNNSNIQNVKGTYDYFPNEKRIYKFIEDTGKNVAEKYGFKEISTPIIEPFELFNRSVGENSDIVMKEMFTFKDGSGASNINNNNSSSQLCLRPEGTAGVIRAIINQGSTNQLTPTQRYYYQGPMFRYERPQRGRQRQFHQLGVELIGDQHPLADIEIIDMAMEFINKLGLSSNNDKYEIELKINSLGDLESIENYQKVLKSFYKENQHLLSEDSIKRLERNNSLRILDSKDLGDIKLNKLAPLLSDHLLPKCKDRFNQVLKGLDNLNIKYTIDQSLVRGLDYYRHTIFEIIIKNKNIDGGDAKSIALPPPLAILGGGRYDGLANQLGYKKSKDILPSIGWATGIDRIILYLDENKMVPKFKNPIGIVTADSSLSNDALKICSRLRKNGIHTMLSTYKLDEDNLSKQLKKLVREESPTHVIILAPTEINENTVIIKDMLNSTQSIVPLNEIEQYLINKI